MIIEVVPGVSWYDTFYDAAVGATSLTGWTKYGAGSIVVISDPIAYGGRAISVANDAEVGLGMDIAGSPVDFEVVARFRASGESDDFNPVAFFGGPGGRIIDDTYLGGVMVGLECTAFVQTCEFFCGLGYITAEYPEWSSQLHTRGDPDRSVLMSGSGTSTAVGTISAYGRALGGNGLWQSGMPASFSVPQPNGSVCLSNLRQGYITKAYSWARMRIVDGLVSFKVWADWAGGEPTAWDKENIDITANFWPASAGPVGFLTTRSTIDTLTQACYTGQDGAQVKTYLDMVSISLDPVGEPPTIPTAVNITSTCPLPSAKRGAAYSYQILSTVPAP